ncbi:MAG TPA: hypothetical protein VEO56_06425 [Bacteroidota bacterium]|nr:hypothetical protein [Bacteroidota bacterium]
MRSLKFALTLSVSAGLLCGMVNSSSTAVAGEQSASIEIEKLILFKNGMGFIVSRATLPDNAEFVRMGQFPIPSFGTFWVGYPKDLRLESLVTSLEEVQQSVSARSLEELLLLNAGRKVKVHTQDKEIEGTVEPVAKSGVSSSTSPYVMGLPGARETYGQLSLPGVPMGPIIIRTETGVVALNLGSIRSVEFADRDPALSVHSTQKSPVIHMKLTKPAGGEEITISYLARGVTWVPAYLIDLSDATSARVSAHAVIVNEMANFDHVKLQLVTGFPNIRFGDIANPIAKSQSLADFLNALSGSTGRPMGVSSMLSNQSAAVALRVPQGEGAFPLVPGYSTAAEGQVAEDLYFYPVKDFTLKKDETAWVPLFTAEMPYKHIYTWHVADMIDEGGHYRVQPESQDQKSTEEIWHSCRLENTLSMPLTTAAAEFVTNGEFTGQDVCYYTPPKGETVIHINKALNLVADQSEVEMERKRDALIVRNFHYDAVKLHGELRISNKLDKAVTVEITKELSGDVLESTPQAKDVKTAKGLTRVNPRHVLTWELELHAGADQLVSYQYQVYLPG